MEVDTRGGVRHEIGHWSLLVKCVFIISVLTRISCHLIQHESMRIMFLTQNFSSLTFRSLNKISGPRTLSLLNGKMVGSE